MIDIEYLLIFGLPENKIELIDGRTPLCMCFSTPEEAQTQYVHWLGQLAKWQQAPPPEIERGGPTGRTWTSEVAGFRLKLDLCRIDVEVPMEWGTFDAAYSMPWRREFWPGQPPGRERGWARHWKITQDVRMGIWMTVRAWEERAGGRGGGKLDLLLTDRTQMNPDGLYFRPERKHCFVGGNWFEGGPDVVFECLSPAMMAQMPQRMALYESAGTCSYWRIDADVEAVDVFLNGDKGFSLVGRFRKGEVIPCEFGDVDPAAIFEPFGRERWPEREEGRGEDEPVARWIAPPDCRVGLQHILVLGHPDRRFEYWDGRARCVLAFGSEEEARQRLVHFAEEAGRWQGTAAPEAVSDSADVGRFHFQRENCLIHLGLDMDPKVHHRWLQLWHEDGSWKPEVPYQFDLPGD